MTPAGKITIITVVLNAADPLEETMASVIPFLSENVEYIVVDGGSSDGTLHVLRQNESFLKRWLSEPDEGVYDAMNKGWRLADEDSWVLFLGAGDRLLALPDRLPKETASRKVFFGHVVLNGNQTFVPRAGLCLKLYNSLHHQALLVPKRLHPEPPFSLDFPIYADFDFNQRLAKCGVLFEYRYDLKAYAAPGGLTSTTNSVELHRIIKKNYGTLWAALSFLGFKAAEIFPFLRHLRPIHE